MVRQEAEEEEEEREEVTKKPAFKPPEFDETEFLQTENRSAKLIYISLGTAFAAGIVTFGIMTGLHMLDLGGEFTVPLVIPFLFAGVAVYLFGRFGIDVRNLEWKKWLENGVMFVVAWFAVWLVSMNPPFSDFADPTVSEPLMELEVASGQKIYYLKDRMFVGETEQDFSSISELEDVAAMKVYATVTDNWDLKSVDISVEYSIDGETIRIGEGEMLNLSISRIDENLDVPKNVSNAMDDEWLISDDDVREEYMYVISMVFDNQTSLDLGEGVPFRVLFTAEDNRGNEIRKELPFRIHS
jgi:hypothetical protein